MSDSPRDEPGRSTHQELREQLGALALGALPPYEAAAVRAHLDGCPSCRAELAELEPLAHDLRLVDVRQLDTPASPPSDLGRRIQAAVRDESELRDRRRRSQRARRRLTALAVPALSAAAGVVATVVVLGGTPEAPVAGPVVPTERLTVQTVGTDVSVSSAVLIPHTWGLEVELVASGLTEGEPYRGMVRTRDGRELPAGEFLGTGAAVVRCDLQAALLRGDAASFSVVDGRGAPVVQIPL